MLGNGDGRRCRRWVSGYYYWWWFVLFYGKRGFFDICYGCVDDDMWIVDVIGRYYDYWSGRKNVKVLCFNIIGD